MPLASSISLIIGGVIIAGKAIYSLSHLCTKCLGDADDSEFITQRTRARRGIRQPGVIGPSGTYGSLGTQRKRSSTATNPLVGSPNVSKVPPSPARGNSSSAPSTAQGYAKPSASANLSVAATRHTVSSSVLTSSLGQTNPWSYQGGSLYGGAGNTVFSDTSDCVTSTTGTLWLGNAHGEVSGGQDRLNAQHSTERNKTPLKPRTNIHHPVRHQWKVKPGYYSKQRTPRKTKDELLRLIDLEVAKSDRQFTFRDKDQVGSERRKAAWDLRFRSDTARELADKAFSEHRGHDGRLLLTIQKQIRSESMHIDGLAAAEIYAHYNQPRFDSDGSEITSSLCDVHGLYIPESCEFVARFLTTRKALRDVRIIVGRGAHSEGGAAKLKPAILKFLKDRSDIEEFKIDDLNEGCILVRLKLPSEESMAGHLMTVTS